MWADADVHVFSKHWDPGELDLARRSPCAIFDVCDEHFTSNPAALALYPWIRDHYYRMCEVARVVTTGSKALARIIKEKTGRDAVVIEEPWERGGEWPAEFGGGRLLWFGHAANLGALNEILWALEDHPDVTSITVVANNIRPGDDRKTRCLEWTPPVLERELGACDLIIIPQTELWKSANRAVTAIRAGRFVLADPVESYEGLEIWTGGVLEGLEWLKSNRGSITGKIRLAQERVRERFNPKKIAQAWSDCISGAVENASPVS